MLSLNCQLIRRRLSDTVIVRSLKTCITGIGNPEPGYNGTRHNAGLMMLDLLKENLLDRNMQKAFQKCADVPAKFMNVSPNLLLIRSDGDYMNLSGKTVVPLWKKLSKYGNITHIVVHDELNLPLGKVQLRKPGTSLRGHNGLKSIYSQYGSGEFYRLAIGIGRPVERDPKIVSDYVLGKFTVEERDCLSEEAFSKALKLLKHII